MRAGTGAELGAVGPLLGDPGEPFLQELSSPIFYGTMKKRAPNYVNYNRAFHVSGNFSSSKGLQGGALMVDMKVSGV